MRLTALPFILLAVPLMEIATFVVVGSRIGVLPTIGLVLLTAISGAILLRIQGFGILARIRAEMQAGRVPGEDMASGVMIMAAGLLLLTPGFITDTIGLLLFVPAIRKAVFGLISRRIAFVGASGVGASGRPFERPWNRPPPPGDRGATIDLDPREFHVEPDEPEVDAHDQNPDSAPTTSPSRKV